MSRRLEVEITSLRDDATFTWRVVGAKQPKGEARQSILPAGSKVGDQLRAEADFLLDGIELLSVLPPKAARKEPKRLEITGSGSGSTQLVTTQLVGKGDRPRRDRGERGDRGPRSDRGPRGDRPDGGRGGRDRRDGGERGEGRPGGDRFRHPAPPPLPEKPKPKRLRARRVHRDAVIAGLPPEQVPIAEQIMLGGIPAVRAAIEKQNETNREAGLPEVHTADLLTLAENLAPSLKAADWRDRADAAMADIDTLDLRDLRSVVVGADGAATDDEGRAMAARLREALNTRVEQEQASWLEEIQMLIASGRTIRALRLSSRPPKAGSPIPAEVAKELAAATVASVDDTTTQDRWGAVLDALAFSPIRGLVTFPSLPTEPSPELINTVTAVADRIPAIATAMGIDPSKVSRAARNKRRPGQGGRPIPAPPKSAASTAGAAAPTPAPAAETKPTVVADVAEPVVEETGGANENVTDVVAEVPAPAETAEAVATEASDELAAAEATEDPVAAEADAVVDSAPENGADAASDVSPEPEADTESAPEADTGDANDVGDETSSAELVVTEDSDASGETVEQGESE